MTRVYLLKYNNYYNRILKQEDTITQYKNYLVKYTPDLEPLDIDENGNSNVLENVNFNMGDYVNTSLIVNWMGDMPDYILVTDEKKVYSDDEDNPEGESGWVEAVSSRWFVTNITKENFGQNSLMLYRDLLVDHLEDIKEQPCFIEKGVPLSLNDPAIFNNENMGFNQIKQEEILLKDKTNCAWIVGYMPRNTAGATDVNVSYSLSGSADFTETTLSNWKYQPYINHKLYYNMNDAHFETKFAAIPSGKSGAWFPNTNKHTWADIKFMYHVHETNSGTFNMNVETSFIEKYHSSRTTDYDGDLTHYCRAVVNYGIGSGGYYWQGPIHQTAETVLIKGSVTNLNNMFNFTTGRDALYSSARIPSSDMLPHKIADEVMALHNKTLYIETEDRYYTIKVTLKEESKAITGSTSFNTGGRFYYDGTISDQYADALYCGNYGSYALYGNNSWVGGALPAVGTGWFDTLTLTLVPKSQGIFYNIPGPDDRYHLSDQPYDMFCIPYPIDNPDFFITQEDDKGNLTEIDARAGLLAATNIALAQGSGNMYDLQLLPYCPISAIMRDNGIDVSTYARNYVRLKDDTGSETRLNVIVFATQADFSLDLEGPDYAIPAETTIKGKKIKSETEVYRLCSPNYAGIYEFNPQMNNGVTKYHIDCTYKPFAPYIQVHPNFGGLYGRDYEDARGLICGGDFSLPLTSNAWAEYQYNNKNYQEIFDRGIKNQERNNAYQRTIEGAEYELGVFAAEIAGQQYGSSKNLGTGQLWGTDKKWGQKYKEMAETAGKIDLEMNNALRQEAIDYQKDLFGYQMGNIKALADSLVKVSSFTKANKLWPFIEKYGCDTEGTTYQLEALENKLKYNGYTIMRIGKLSEHIINPGAYIKGQLIRLPEGFSTEYHIGVALCKELDMGFYTPEVPEIEEVPEEEEVPEIILVPEEE